MLSNRIQSLAESETIKMSQLSRALSAQGKDVINLSVGEPDFNTPDYIKKGAIAAINDNYSFYTPVPGYLDVREAIAHKLLNENNLSYAPEQIVVSTGAKQSLANAILCLVNPGDEVIIPTPYWVSYSELVKLAEGKSVFINSDIDNDFKITPAQLEAAITPRSKVFMFSSPCNPSGSVYSKDELAALAEVFSRYPELYVISDEIYEHINFIGGHQSIAQFNNIAQRVIVINGFSKAYAMTGWRVGYSASNVILAKAMDKLQGQTTSATCSIAQRAAFTAYTHHSNDLKIMAAAFESRRNLMYSRLSAIPSLKVALPAGAFYFFPDVSAYFNKSFNGKKITNSTDLCMYLLDTAYVSTVPGSSFGNENCIRLSYALAEEKLSEACHRIHKALEQLV